jgi:hypothetical protein
MNPINLAEPFRLASEHSTCAILVTCRLEYYNIMYTYRSMFIIVINFSIEIVCVVLKPEIKYLLSMSKFSIFCSGALHGPAAASNRWRAG